MNTILLLLLGAAVIIIIIQANSKKKKTTPLKSSFTEEKPQVVPVSTSPSSGEEAYFLGQDQQGEYQIGFEEFTLTGVHLPGRKKHIIEFCNEEDKVTLIHEKNNKVNPQAIAVKHQGKRIGYIADEDLDEVHNLIKFEYDSIILSIEDDGDFLNLDIEIEYIIPEKKKKQKKVKPQSNSDITPEDFMIWKSNEIPSEYLKPKKDIEDTSSFFYGKKVCISGQLDSFPYRAELAKHLWDVGADVDTGVGKTCEILISGDGVGPSKLKKAKQQGVQIMDGTELDLKLNGFKSKLL